MQPRHRRGGRRSHRRPGGPTTTTTAAAATFHSYRTVVGTTAAFVIVCLFLGAGGPALLSNTATTTWSSSLSSIIAGNASLSQRSGRGIVFGPDHAPLDDAVLRQVDAILVLGGGRPSNLTTPPVYVQRRCDDAAALRQRHAALMRSSSTPATTTSTKPLPILCLSAGTAHLPQLLSANGLPVWESTSCAAYLNERYFAKDSMTTTTAATSNEIYVETTSYDTIGNAFYGRVTHTDWAGWRNLLVITNGFHMDRTVAIFDWIFASLEDVPPSPTNSFHRRPSRRNPYRLWYYASPNEGLAADALEARQTKEAAGLAQVQQYTTQYRTLAQVYRFLTTQHGLYAAAPLVDRGTQPAAAAGVSALVQQSYGGTDGGKGQRRLNKSSAKDNSNPRNTNARARRDGSVADGKTRVQKWGLGKLFGGLQGAAAAKIEPTYLDPPPGATFVTLSNGYKMRYTDTHHGKTAKTKPNVTFVLVHGFGGCLETWNKLVPSLVRKNKKKIRVIALDLLGNGFSDKPLDITYTLRNQGKILADFLRAKDLVAPAGQGKLILVGHSAAGMVVSSAAGVLPRGSLDGLVLVAPGFYQVRRPMYSKFPWWGRAKARALQAKMGMLLEMAHLDATKLSTETKTAFAAQWQTPNATKALEEMVIAREDPYEQVLSEIPDNLPLHIVWSKEDTINPFAAEEIQEYLNAMPRSPPFSYSLLSGSQHYIQHEIPEKLAAEIGLFVTKLQLGMGKAKFMGRS